MSNLTGAEYLIREFSRLLAEVRENVIDPEDFLELITDVIDGEEFYDEYFEKEDDEEEDTNAAETLLFKFTEAAVMLTNATMSPISVEEFGYFLEKFAQLFNYCGSYETYKCVQKFSEELGSALHKLLNIYGYAEPAIDVCQAIHVNKHEDPEFGETWGEKYLEKYKLYELIERISQNVDQFWDDYTRQYALSFHWGRNKSRFSGLTVLEKIKLYNA